MTLIFSRYFKTPFGTILCWLLEKVVLLFPDEYAKEMEGYRCFFLLLFVFQLFSYKSVSQLNDIAGGKKRQS